MSGRFEWIEDTYPDPPVRTLYWVDPEGVYTACTGDSAAMSVDDWAEALDATWLETYLMTSANSGTARSR